MKVSIIYYSFSGNTRKTSEYLRDRLEKIGVVVNLEELKLLKEERSFFLQGKQAQKKETPEYINKNFALETYDVIILASPVWAFTFAPALRSFLVQVQGLENKPVACFLTCGAALASGNALKELESSIKAKGGKLEFSCYIRGIKSNDGSYLDKQFDGLFNILKSK